MGGYLLASWTIEGEEYIQPVCELFGYVTDCFDWFPDGKKACCTMQTRWSIECPDR